MSAELFDGLQGLHAVKSEPLWSGIGASSTQAFDELDFLASRARRGSMPPAPPNWAAPGGDALSSAEALGGSQRHLALLR